MTDETEWPTVIMDDKQWQWFQKQEMMRTASALDASNQHRVAMTVSTALMTGNADAATVADASVIAITLDKSRRDQAALDNFAAAALQGLLATGGRDAYDDIVGCAWEIADAMMEARK